MKHKKLYITALLLAFGISLCGCGASESKQATDATAEPATATESNTTTENNTTVETDTTIENNATAGTGATTEKETTPFSLHGALSVDGTDLVDCNGEKFQLYGMSTHGLAWFPGYVNYDTFEYLYEEWHTNCIRLAMYTHETGGYCSGGDQEKLKTLIMNGVDYATELGMYVIIDWHVLNDQNPLTYQEEAAAFFEEMSSLYADYDNVIYEICNEPNTTASWEDITSFSNEIIPVIRNNDSNAIIIVGTPTWSQDIDQAAAAPLEYDNIMYALHFYAATHTDWLRNRMEQCIKDGLPVIVSEFGICDASGNGQIDMDQANAWKELIEEYNVSYLCWNLSNKNESSSIIKSTCIKLYDWTEDELSTQGKWISEWFKSEYEGD